MIWIICVSVLATGLYLWMIMPVAADPSSFPVDRFAHRGLHGGRIPENSLSAFRAAKQAGLGVELDIQFTKDRKIVVCHDPDLKRMCGEDVRLIDTDYSELSGYRLADSEETVPLFSDVLRIMSPLPVICEIKADNGIKNTEICDAVLPMLRDYPGFICVESFSPFVVAWFKKNAPDIMRGQLSLDDVRGQRGSTKIQRIILRMLVTDFMSRPNFIAYRYTDGSLALKMIRLMRKVPLAGWTPRGSGQVRDAFRKFDAVIFEKGGDDLEEIFPENIV